MISVRARGTEQRHLDAFLDEPGSIVVAHDAVLKGLDLSQATAALNYDVSPDPRRMHIRWSRLDWRDPSLPPEVVTLQPSPMLPREERAFSKMPYLAGDSDLV